jgi:hypothetical protein
MIIEIIVSPTGQTRIETKGFAGAECRRASESLEKALGAKLSEQLTRSSIIRPAKSSRSLGRDPEMSTVRRRILRSELPIRPAGITEQRRRRAHEKKQGQLERERVLLARWMTRLKRAFHAVERGQRRVLQLERTLTEIDPS